MSNEIYRIATVEEFRKLWNYSESNTYKYFEEGLLSNNIEFWTVELDKELIGELYIFWNSEDQDEANGLDRAYLCAFRIRKDHQNKGYGKKLMNVVFERIEEKGYTEITLGIDNAEYDKLKYIYDKLGFIILVKETYIDYHYITKDGTPDHSEEPFKIMMKKVK